MLGVRAGRGLLVAGPVLFEKMEAEFKPRQKSCVRHA
jgi:hypothetical protein